MNPPSLQRVEYLGGMPNSQPCSADWDVGIGGHGCCLSSGFPPAVSHVTLAEMVCQSLLGSEKLWTGSSCCNSHCPCWSYLMLQDKKPEQGKEAGPCTIELVLSFLQCMLDTDRNRKLLHYIIKVHASPQWEPLKDLSNSNKPMEHDSLEESYY